jgi:hypothetical protein
MKPIQVWITISETETERTQRRTKALRVQGGLAVTYSGFEGKTLQYVLTHLATGKRLTGPMPKAIAIGLLAKVLQIADWSLERPMVSRADWDRLGLGSAEKEPNR